MSRVYLDYNATTPLRPEARAAMIKAMDVLGNPSSVHFEGRAARKILENARAKISEKLGATNADIVFTSGASEAAALALGGLDKHCSALEHPCVLAHCTPSLIPVDGLITDQGEDIVRQLANSETGIIQRKARPVYLEDAVQAIGKIPYAFSWRRAKTALVSAHKFGGPRGVGALLLDPSLDLKPLIKGGGQEGSRRAGTENIIGIVGMAAALEAAEKDLLDGVMDEVRVMRDRFEAILLDAVDDIFVLGKDQDRLPNTSCFAHRGHPSDLQVIRLDLAGFSVSAGSACSSGKVRESAGLLALGHDRAIAQSAIRMSIGKGIDWAMLEKFARECIKLYKN